jgi:hypothetical protein
MHSALKFAGKVLEKDAFLKAFTLFLGLSVTARSLTGSA